MPRNAERPARTVDGRCVSRSHGVMASTLFTFRKSASQADQDRRDRVARVGGLWRQPNYLRSYAKASAMLLGAAGDADCYDDVGLPLFYLQRHTVELAIKEVLHTLLDISEMEEILAVPEGGDWRKVADACGRRPRKVAEGHLLGDLVADAKKLLAARLPRMPLPDDFERLVAIVATIENDANAKPRPDRFRYPHMKPGKGEMRHHAQSIASHVVRDGNVESAPATLLPLGALDDALQALLNGPMRCESYEDDTFFAALALEVAVLGQRLAAVGRL